MEDSGFLKLQRLTDDELGSFKDKAGVIERYCYLLDEQDKFMIRDMEFGSGIKIGNQHCQLYTLADVADLPRLCGSRINYDKYSTDRTKFSIGFASSIGQLLPCNHIYNQYIFIEDDRATLKKLESKKLRLQSLSAYSRENTISRDSVNDFLNEAIGMQRLAVKAHFNVLVWSDDKEKLKEIKNQVSSAFAIIDAVAKEETAGAAQIFWAGIPETPLISLLMTRLILFWNKHPCFLNLEGSAKSVLPSQGIRFCDRLSSAPVYADLFNSPREAGVTSNMGVLCCGSSGAGKSMVINHLLNSLYTQGAHCLIVDIGGSYKGLCELLKGYYFTYEETNPIRFNPFYLPDGQYLDTEKERKPEITTSILVEARK